MAETITLLLYVIAAARLTHLIHADRITRPLRWWLVLAVAKRHQLLHRLDYNRPGFRRNPELAAEVLTRAGADSLALYWIGCVWCVSIAAAAIPATLYVLAPTHPVALILAATLAFSWVTVLLHQIQLLLAAKVRLYTPTPSEPEREGADGP